MTEKSLHKPYLVFKHTSFATCFYSCAVAALVKVSAPFFFFFFFLLFYFGVTFVHANLCQPANFYNYSKKELQRKTIFFLSFQQESNSRPLNLKTNALSTGLRL